MSPEPSLDPAGQAEVDVAWGDLSAQTHGVQLCWLFVSPLVSVNPLAFLCAPDLLPPTASALLTPGGGDAAAPADSSRRTREGTAGRFMNPARPHIDTSDQPIPGPASPTLPSEPTREGHQQEVPQGSGLARKGEREWRGANTWAYQWSWRGSWRVHTPEGIHPLASSTRETYPSRRTIMDGKGIPPLLAGQRATVSHCPPIEVDRRAEEADDAAMTRTTITQITDDIDGSKDAEEVAFSFMGTDYTIDLAKKNRAAFEKAMKPYIDAGTRVSRRTRPGSTLKKSSTKSSGGADLKAMRAWAIENGFEISARGRIPKAVVEAYDNAQG